MKKENCTCGHSKKYHRTKNNQHCSECSCIRFLETSKLDHECEGDEVDIMRSMNKPCDGILED